MHEIVMMKPVICEVHANKIVLTCKPTEMTNINLDFKKEFSDSYCTIKVEKQ